MRIVPNHEVVPLQYENTVVPIQGTNTVHSEVDLADEVEPESSTTSTYEIN